MIHGTPSTRCYIRFPLVYILVRAYFLMFWVNPPTAIVGPYFSRSHIADMFELELSGV